MKACGGRYGMSQLSPCGVIRRHTLGARTPTAAAARMGSNKTTVKVSSTGSVACESPLLTTRRAVPVLSLAMRPGSIGGTGSSVETEEQPWRMWMMMMMMMWRCWWTAPSQNRLLCTTSRKRLRPLGEVSGLGLLQRSRCCLAPAAGAGAGSASGGGADEGGHHNSGHDNSRDNNNNNNGACSRWCNNLVRAKEALNDGTATARAVPTGEETPDDHNDTAAAAAAAAQRQQQLEEEQQEQAIVAAQEKAAAEEASSSDDDEDASAAQRAAARKMTPGAKQHCLSPNAVVPPTCVLSPEPREDNPSPLSSSPSHHLTNDATQEGIKETIVLPTAATGASPVDSSSGSCDVQDEGSATSSTSSTENAVESTAKPMWSSVAHPSAPHATASNHTVVPPLSSAHPNSTTSTASSSNADSKTTVKPSGATEAAATTPGAAAAGTASASPPKKKPSDFDRAGENIPIWRVVKLVWTYLWPKGQWKMKLLVVSSVTCVLTAKVLKVMLPFTFKAIIDALTPAAAVVTSAGAAAGSAVVAAEGTAVSAAALTTAAEVAMTTLGPLTLTACGFVVAYGLCRVAGSICEEFKNVFFAPVGGAGSTNLAMQMVRKMHDLDLPFHLNRETGVLSKDLDRGSRAFWNLAYLLLFMVVPTAFEMALVGTALCTQGGGPFVSIAAVAVVAYIAWTLVITNWRAKFRARFNRYDSRVGGRIVDSLLNYETVKYFGSEAYECARIEKEVRKMNRQLVILDQSIALLNVGQQLIFAVAAVGSLYMATCGVLAGVMTVGDLVLVDGLLLQLYMPLSYLGMIYRDIQSSTQNMQAMIALMDAECIVKDTPDAKPYVHRDGTIEFRNVSFEYSTIKKTQEENAKVDESNDTEVQAAQKNSNNNNNSNSNNSATDASDSASTPPAAPVPQPPSLPTKRRLGVLHNVNLHIPGGSVVAFVGASGSGKSTIFRLLFRFFNPTEGTVLLDGQSIDRLQMKSVRKHIGVIPQDPILFNQSIRYNICYSKPSATMEEVERVARLANLHDTIMTLPDGYETGVGERGCKLSGGEKQRVAIARALLDDRPILLADEATSALDTATEAKVMRALRSRTQSGSPRTVLLIAHRLTTVKDADIIFVLGDGGVAECGGHDELLAINGMYARLWHRQLEEKEKEEEAKADTTA